MTPNFGVIVAQNRPCRHSNRSSGIEEGMANALTTPEWAKTPNFGVIVALRHFGAASTSKLFAREWRRQNHTTQPEKPVNDLRFGVIENSNNDPSIWGHFSLRHTQHPPARRRCSLERRGADVKNQPGVYVSNNQ